jgi:integrase
MMRWRFAEFCGCRLGYFSQPWREAVPPRDQQWTVEDIEKLKGLWPDHSGGEIAYIMRRSRNSVLGKAYRLNLMDGARKPRRRRRGHRVRRRRLQARAVLPSVERLQTPSVVLAARRPGRPPKTPPPVLTKPELRRMLAEAVRRTAELAHA